MARGRVRGAGEAVRERRGGTMELSYRPRPEGNTVVRLAGGYDMERGVFIQL